MSDCDDCNYLHSRVEHAISQLLDHASCHGQPRQADPSGDVLLSTDQQDFPAGKPQYCTAIGQISSGVKIACCQTQGHSGLHESFGGVQW